MSILKIIFIFIHNVYLINLYFIIFNKSKLMPFSLSFHSYLLSPLSALTSAINFIIQSILSLSTSNPHSPYISRNYRILSCKTTNSQMLHSDSYILSLPTTPTLYYLTYSPIIIDSPTSTPLPSLSPSLLHHSTLFCNLQHLFSAKQ